MPQLSQEMVSTLEGKMKKRIYVYFVKTKKGQKIVLSHENPLLVPCEHEFQRWYLFPSTDSLTFTNSRGAVRANEIQWTNDVYDPVADYLPRGARASS